MTDARPRAEVLRQTAASMGCSGPVLDDAAHGLTDPRTIRALVDAMEAKP